MVVLTCFIMRGYVCMCGSFDNCVVALVKCVVLFIVSCIVCTVFFLLFHSCIFILICFVCTSVKTTATE